MERPFTVYFDTNFFVWLRKANEDEANQILDELNSLRIRHVLSDILIRELLSLGNKPHYDERLIKRVQRFELPPYCTEDYLAWEALLSSGDLRRFVADFFKKTIDEALTEANSHSIMGRRIASGRVSPENLSELANSTKPFLHSLGFSQNTEDLEENLQSAHTLAETIMNLKDLLPDGTISGELNWSGNPMEDSQMLLGLLNPRAVEEAEESNLLIDSTTTSEDRPYQVAAGIANASTKQGLAHTLRDSEHMKSFVLHKDEIDLIQVDRAQLNLIKNVHPIHRLVELGLSERCFSVSSLNEIPGLIRKLKVH